MNSLHIFIVEDDMSAALDVEMLLTDMGYENITTFNNGPAALEAILEHRPDLVIMDIGLGGELTGLDIAQQVRHLKIPVIFTTAFSDPAFFEEAKATRYYGYLVKPFNRITLESTIEQAIKSIPQQPALKAGEHKWLHQDMVRDTLLVKQQGVFYKLKFDEILFIKGTGNYSIVHTKNKKYMVRLSLRKVMEELNSDQFIPVHKSFIANLEQVTAIDPGACTLAMGAETLPLGRNFKYDLLEKYKTLK